ncbi:DUF4340 domain-containing protein [Agaribacterium haliotis]|uniref:DUF4340 domain-containing protein n=1 Tax=Agaribacterium haliotis TaxID=2013869 RepID=UPI000BB59AC0|nr:DUF4340 domain-containing protein [Agaribacterium haliotis]
MNNKNVLFLFTALALTLLFACGKNAQHADDNTNIHTNKHKHYKNKLFPELANNLDKLVSINIKTVDSELQLIKKNKQWYLAPPYSVPVYPEKIHNVLFELANQSQGQEILVNRSDYKSHGVASLDTNKDQDSEQVELNLGFNDKKLDNIHCILGKFDFSDDHESRLIYGAKAVARRYVRCSNSNKVYLVPASLSSLNTDLRQWENTQSPAMRNMRSITVTAPDGFTWSASRPTSYAPIQLSPPFNNIKQNKELVETFNRFLVSGYYEGIVPHSEEKLFTSSNKHWVIQAKDKAGQEFHLTVYGEAPEKEKKDYTSVLSPGMMSMAPIGRDGKLFAVKLHISNAKDRGQHHTAINLLNQRMIYLLGIDVTPAMRVTDTLRQENFRQENTSS